MRAHGDARGLRGRADGGGGKGESERDAGNKPVIAPAGGRIEPPVDPHNSNRTAEMQVPTHTHFVQTRFVQNRAPPQMLMPAVEESSVRQSRVHVPPCPTARARSSSACTSAFTLGVIGTDGTEQHVKCPADNRAHGRW